MSSNKTFGEYLPDQVDRITRITDVQLHILNDVCEIYKERASLEKDYANKLNALVKKASEKKTKRIAALVVGDEPAKKWNEGVLKQSTMDNAYTQLLSSLEHAVQCHNGYADALNLQIVEAAKSLEHKHDEMKKKQIQFYEKLLTEKDRVYHGRVKSKQKYDEECLEIESHRQNQDRHSQDKHALRAAKHYEQQKIDMLNKKNTYIIATVMANQYNVKFYKDFIPALENQLQFIQKNLVKRMTFLLQEAQSLQLTHLDSFQKSVLQTQDALSKVDPDKDQDIFIEYNIREFSLPVNWEFEPCKGYYDTGELSVEQAPKVFMQNKLHNCRKKLDEIIPLLDAKKRETEQLHLLVDTYTKNPDLGDIEEVEGNYIDAQQQFVMLSSSACVLQTEIDTIVGALAGDEGSQQPHTFKSASFSIPATCGYCEGTIWGLSKQGKTCKSCNVSVHVKCEMKMPAECPGKQAKHPAHAALASTPNLPAASDSDVSLASVSSLPSAFVNYHTAHDEFKIPIKVLYDFTPTSVYELEVHEGQQLFLVEEDDGTGWVKVDNGEGGKGLVPATYIEMVPNLNGSNQAIFSSSSLPLKSGKYVRGIYPYQARGETEIDVDVGEMIELTDNEFEGESLGDGWAEGVDRHGKKGIFPVNYVEDA